MELAGLSPESILDYGCGHGRVLRWFQSFWPNANLTAADVTEDQIEFCARTFGANPFLIDKPFDEVELPSEYDLIWLGSIF
ncbi:MAG: class I SAM-dependent methyltransferase, partial [Rubrobacteraceae bacterium]